ncbi:hypothetical protein [Pelosinus propionicus]|uniref:Uncharacterized protein n=1 Tax=Pelosinus propionicus DSM 13327 TaxID=1123291 RepID=A0A1I4Q2H7_9FIRM|nr:hypothetical protein [Pelosinus propionicus]SFM34204.1 hypothetical protein SAMN04490355_10819 [Pelosinus propionicus DSM 13327]
MRCHEHGFIDSNNYQPALEFVLVSHTNVSCIIQYKLQDNNLHVAAADYLTTRELTILGHYQK